jgi:hypothetical protein
VVGSLDAFRDGYIAGWRSVRGADENPDVPACPVQTGMSMYLVGFSRGVRDARVDKVVTLSHRRLRQSHLPVMMGNRQVADELSVRLGDEVDQAAW